MKERLKEGVRPWYAWTRRQARSGVHAVLAKRNSRPTVVHHGIQRSGTNYACALLEQSGYFVLNRVDPRRDDPRHKHFRWQPDKSTISMDVSFRNSTVVGSVAELNAAAGWPPEQHHFLVFKTPDEWLMSIERWAVASGWIGRGVDDADLDAARRRWLIEWDAYHSTWFGLAVQNPDRILTVAYQDLISEPQTNLDLLHSMTGARDVLPLLNEGQVGRVAHSHGRRPSGRASEEQRVLVSELVTCDWRSFLRPS